MEIRLSNRQIDEIRNKVLLFQDVTLTLTNAQIKYVRGNVLVKKAKPRRNEQIDSEMLNKIVKLYEEGLSTKNIALEVGLAYQPVYERLKKHYGVSSLKTLDREEAKESDIENTEDRFKRLCKELI